MRNPLSRRPDTSRPSLRERAASLRAAAERLIRGEPVQSTEPAPIGLAFGALDPMHGLIERHRAAWFAFQIAPPGEATILASDELDIALQTLLGTGCTCRADAVDLLRHLHWFLNTEGVNNPADNFDWRVAQARAIDLALLLGPAASRPR
ncbi:hypothetical protein MKK63_16860 [Methylobacterium sp. J-088]|uniref:hypothetical protein n=1 Tax=Methylobacterium sp. J-088 TaxID=2836664 RepID=UPI001FBBBF59|nr:hypothetical protein [Methylobacterium sp. J-088]MCJ2064372.1 hypothetical protein [Methylobacterium sp. J-088]